MRLVQERIEDLQGDSDDDDGRLATGRDEFDEASCHGGTTDASPSRRRIDIRFIPDKNKRHISFSKRKAGIFKKAHELATLTGTQVLLLIVSETGVVYTYTTPRLGPLVTAKEGQKLIQACLTGGGDSASSEEAITPPLVDRNEYVQTALDAAYPYTATTTDFADYGVAPSMLSAHAKAEPYPPRSVKRRRTNENLRQAVCSPPPPMPELAGPVVAMLQDDKPSLAMLMVTYESHMMTQGASSNILTELGQTFHSLARSMEMAPGAHKFGMEPAAANATCLDGVLADYFDRFLPSLAETDRPALESLAKRVLVEWIQWLYTSAFISHHMRTVLHRRCGWVSTPRRVSSARLRGRARTPTKSPRPDAAVARTAATASLPALAAIDAPLSPLDYGSTFLDYDAFDD